MNDAPLETLLRPFEMGTLGPLSGDVLVLRGRAHHALKRLGGSVQVTQPFKPEADKLERDAYVRIAERDALARQWDWILILPPRSRDEMRALLAGAAAALTPAGRIVMSVANTEGAKAAESDLKALLGTVGSDTKNKCRVMWTPPHQHCVIDMDLLEQWQSLLQVSMQKDTGLKTRRGVFSWQHADPASTLLIEHMPTDLRGNAADLGAGIGLLSKALAAHNRGILHIDAYEAQEQAIDLLKDNLQGLDVTVHWHDVEQGINGKYDVIIMNPPFHALSRDGRTDIGIRFIEVAAQALKANGTLLMVANRHLPYESTVKQHFATVQTLAEGNGFKVIRAGK